MNNLILAVFSIYPGHCAHTARYSVLSAKEVAGHVCGPGHVIHVPRQQWANTTSQEAKPPEKYRDKKPEQSDNANDHLSYAKITITVN